VRSITRRLDGDIDLLTMAGHDGVLWERSRAGVAGRGVALRVPLDDIDDALAGIEVDDEVGVPGSGPVAFGALPFVPGAATELIVPAEIWGRSEDGTRWHTVIGDPGELDAISRTSSGLLRREQPSRFTVEPTRSAEWWCDHVERTTKALADGTLEKVVLAREVLVTADGPIDPVAVLTRLRAGYPGCHIFHVDGFVGASPELLVSRAGDVVRSHPMAGTAPRGGDPSADARLAASLLASSKDRAEHQITIDMVHDTLLPWCSYLDYEAEPSIVAVANLQHLATMVEGRLSQPAPSVLDLVRALHPTPAVCGQPRDAAMRYILDQEGFDRGRYAGAVGWVDARGNGSWAVSVRTAQLDGETARVCAGCGIVADSEPDTELEESRVKLQAMLSAIVRP
jgi:menaquinone-specific isochorismate synthase